MSFECLYELNHHVFKSSFALDNIGVSLCIICGLDILNFKFITFPVGEELVGLLYKLSPSLIHFTSNKDQELFVVDGSVKVVVERAEEGGYVLLADAHFKVFAGLEKLYLRESSTLIVIHDLENSL